MPAKKEERGAEIDSCSLKIWEEKIKILLYAWEKVYTYGDAESMCTDGIILNRYRQEILYVKSHLENLGSELSYAVPEKKIRIQSFKNRLPMAADFFIVKFINRLEFFYCIVSKIWYSKYDNQSVCVDTYQITEKVI